MTAAGLVMAAVVASCAPNGDAPEQVVDAYLEAYNAADLRGVARTFAPGAIVPTPRGDLTINEVLRNYEANLFGHVPDLRTSVDQRLARGDTVAEMESTTGINDETFVGLTVYRVSQGCIISMSTSE